MVQRAAVPLDPLLTILALSSICVGTCFIPLVFVVLYFGFAGPAFETFLCNNFGCVCADLPPYHFPSKATLRSLTIIMRVIQIVRTFLVESNLLLAVWTGVFEPRLVCYAYVSFTSYHWGAQPTLTSFSIVMCVI